MRKIFKTLAVILSIFIIVGCTAKSDTKLEFTKLPNAVYKVSDNEIDLGEVKIKINGTEFTVEEAVNKYGVSVTGNKFSEPGFHTVVITYQSASIYYTYQVVDGSEYEQLVRILNNALLASGVDSHETMFDALQATRLAGFSVERLSVYYPNLLWDSVNDKFTYVSDSGEPVRVGATNVPDYKYWKISSSVDSKYSTYLYNYSGDVVSTTKGIDVGESTNIKEINYINNDSNQDVVIRTNGGTLTVNAPADTVKHYGEGVVLNIEAIAGSSYHEYGSFSKAIIKQGRVVIESSGNIPSFEIAAVPTLTKPIIIETDKDVVVSANDSVIAELEDNKLENVQITVSNPNANVVVDEKVDLTKVTATGKTQEDFVIIEKVRTYTELQTALQAFKKYIKLTSNISYESNGVGLINITYSMTLDGDGYQISGYGNRGGNKTTVAINHNGTTMVDVTLKNLKILNEESKGRAVETRGNIGTINFDNVTINCTGGGNTQGLTIGGSQATSAIVNINNSVFDAGSSGYAYISFNPANVTITNSELHGYAAMYFKGIDVSAGSRGSVVTATNSNFDGPNKHKDNDGWNNFGTFVFEDDGITLSLDSCEINAREDSTARQYAFLLKADNEELGLTVRKQEVISINVMGNSTEIGKLIRIGTGWESDKYSLKISGGKYYEDPSEYLKDGFTAIKKGGLWEVVSK